MAELLRLVVESLSDGALSLLEELLASVELEASLLEELASASLELLALVELASLLDVASVESSLLEELSSDWYGVMSIS